MVTAAKVNNNDIGGILNNILIRISKFGKYLPNAIDNYGFSDMSNDDYFKN